LSDEHDEETNASDAESEQGADRDETGFLADSTGNVEVLDSDDDSGGADQGIGGPEREFGGIVSGGPIHGRQEFQLRPPSFWSRPLRIFLVIAGIIFVGSVLPDVYTGGMSLWVLIGLVGIPLMIGAAVAYRAWKIPEEGLEITFEDESVRMPKGADNPSFVEVDFRDLRSLVVMARGESELLLMETEGHRFVFTGSNFREPNGPRMLKDEIIRRVRSHPESESILRQMEELEERARLASQNPTPVMYALLGMIVAGYIIEHLTGALSSQFGLIQLGANASPLIADGQWWRLISGNFLHGGFVHILMNGFALFVLGMWIERLIGSWRFLWIYLISALGGSLGSFLWTGAPLSVGASTALYGLFGAFGVLHLRYWREMPPPYRQTVTWWVVLMGLNVGISMLPMIDAAAHFAGMGVGAVATYLCLLEMSHLDPRHAASNWVKVPTAVLTAVFAAGLAMASNYAQYEHPGDRTTVYRYMVDRAQQNRSASELNRTSWMIATNPEATGQQLGLAERAAETALEINRKRDGGEYSLWPYGEEPYRLMYQDTLATVVYRLGLKAREDADRRQRFTEAIRIERRILRDLRDGTETDAMLAQFDDLNRQTYRTRLGRFLQVYLQEFGRHEVGSAVPEGVELQLESRPESLALRLDLPRRAETTTELIGLVSNDNTRIGAVHVCVAEDGKGGIVERFAPNQWSTGLGAESRIRLARVDTDDPMCPEIPEGRDWTFDYWPASTDAPKLP